MRYLQLTLRHHDAAGAGGGKQRGEGASVASQESQEAGPREGRGDNQRAGARRPRFIVLDLTQVHGVEEDARPISLTPTLTPTPTVVTLVLADSLPLPLPNATPTPTP